MRSIFMPLGLAVLLAQPTCLYAQAYIATQQLQTGVPVNFAAPTPPPRLTFTLTLAQAIALAFEYNPGLAAAQQEVAAAAGQRVQAAARPNPELSYLSEGVQRERRTTTVEVRQTIELGGKRRARLAVAEREGDIAAAEQATFRNDLRADVVSAFFDVLVAQERTELAEATQRLSQRASDATARRVRAGRISPVDETRARVTEAGSRIELSQATNELALAKRRLAATWANAVPVPDQVIAPDPAPRSADHSREYSQGYSQEHSREQLAASPQLARAQLEVARQQAQIALELSKRTPDLTVTLGTKRDEQLGLRQTVFGVAVPLPLFDRNRGNVESAMRRADKAKEQLKVVRNTLSTQLDEALLRRAGALAELVIIQGEILPGAQSAFDAASKGAELGKFSFLDVIEAQRTLFQAKNQYIRALAQSYRASADIERLTGAQATKTTPEAPPLAPGASQ